MTALATAVPSLLLSPRDAAKVLAISARTLWGLTKEGAIPRIKIGRAVRYDVRDLTAWIDREKEGGRTP